MPRRYEKCRRGCSCENLYCHADWQIEIFKGQENTCRKDYVMKKGLKAVVVLTMAGVMTIAPTVTASAATMKQDDKGYRVENEDGSYLTNQWYQLPNGEWCYLGADGYMLINTTTPDGYYVDASGEWVQEEAEDVQHVASIQDAVKMYKDYFLQDNFPSENYVFVDLNGDGIPECIVTSQYGFRILVCAGNEVKSAESGTCTSSLSYVKEGNLLSIYTEDYTGQITRSFKQLHVNERLHGNYRATQFSQIAYSKIVDGNLYIWEMGNGLVTEQVTRECFDEFNNHFGTLTEIPLDSAHTYKSVDEAYEAFIAQ